MTHRDDRARRRALLAPGAPDQGMDQGMTALSYLITGVLVWGGLGWLGDHFLGVGFLLPLGIVLGAGLGCYMIIARFGGLSTARRSSPDAVEQRGSTGAGNEKESTWAR